MDKILDFIVYALRCVMLLFSAMLGHGEVTDNWLKDTIVGVVTLCIIILILFFIDRLTVKIYRKKRLKIKNQNLVENTSNYVSFCIWGDGPGRPYDNAYELKSKEIDVDQKIIRFQFNGGEECIVENPVGIDWGQKGVRIEKASKIIWKHYYYGKPQTIENTIIFEYILIDESHVHVVVKSNFLNRDEIISIDKEIASVSF